MTQAFTGRLNSGQRGKQRAGCLQIAGLSCPREGMRIVPRIYRLRLAFSGELSERQTASSLTNRGRPSVARVVCIVAREV